MAGEYVRRTAITRLETSPEQRELLEETVTEWQEGCQVAVNEAWGVYDGKSEVQSLAYDIVRERTGLGSQHAVLATHHAARAIAGCTNRISNGRDTSKPQFSAPTVPYDSRTMTLFEDGTVSLTTTDARVRCSLALPEDEDGYQYRFLGSEDWELAESTLTFDDDVVLLHIGFRRHKSDVEQETAEDGTVLGVDLGVENIAVTSTARFFSGEKLNHDLREFEKVRAGLRATGTRSAHRTLDDASGRQLRRIRDEMHQVSNGIVEEALLYECELIVFEDLTHIRDTTNGSWGHRWAFRTLYEQVEYKAESVGITVAQVAPENTSIRCSECGFTTGRNRPDRTSFHCRECLSSANADYNAAKNVGLRYVRRGQQSSRRTGNGRLALKSGTVTPNDGFTAYPDGFEAEFTDKSHRRRANPTG